MKSELWHIWDCVGQQILPLQKKIPDNINNGTTRIWREKSPSKTAGLLAQTLYWTRITVNKTIINMKRDKNKNENTVLLSLNCSLREDLHTSSDL